MARIDRRRLALHDVMVKGVFDVGRRVGGAEEPLGVGEVVGEKPLAAGPIRGPVGREMETAQRHVLGRERVVLGQPDERFHPASLVGAAPDPRIAEPQRGKQMQDGRLRPPVDGRDRDQQVVGPALGIFHRHVEIAVVGEDAGVGQFILRLLPAPPPVLLDQRFVREAALRDTGKGPACRNASGSSRGNSNIPSRPRRGFPGGRSGRRDVP